MWIFATLSAEALACIGDPHDPRVLIPYADRVYRARITEMWDLRERPMWDGTMWNTCEPLSWSSEAQGTAVFSLEVREVWKGEVAAVIHAPVSTLWPVGHIDTFFEKQFDPDGPFYNIVSDCGWDPGVDLGPPRYTHPYEPTLEEALWEAVAEDDPIAVAQALLALPSPETADWEFQAGLRDSSPWANTERFVPKCPPEAYDLLILSRHRPLETLQACPAERILDMLPWIPSSDPGWQNLLLFLDADVLSALDVAGVKPDRSRVDAGLRWSLAEGRGDDAQWWLEQKPSPDLELCTELAPALYSLLDRYEVHPTCDGQLWRAPAR